MIKMLVGNCHFEHGAWHGFVFYTCDDPLPCKVVRSLHRSVGGWWAGNSLWSSLLPGAGADG